MNKIFTKYMGILLLAGCLPGCLSFKQLNKEKPSVPATFSTEKLNGLYANNAAIYEKRSTLWEILYAYNVDKREYLYSKDSVYVAQKTATRLFYDGDKTLTASLIQGDSVLNTISFEVKQKSDYLVFKLNFYIIPIPFLYVNDREWLITLSIDSNGNLVLKDGLEHFGWIAFYATSVTSYRLHEYHRISQ